MSRPKTWKLSLIVMAACMVFGVQGAPAKNLSPKQLQAACKKLVVFILLRAQAGLTHASRKEVALQSVTATSLRVTNTVSRTARSEAER
jgi:hypothetical protein